MQRCMSSSSARILSDLRTTDMMIKKPPVAGGFFYSPVLKLSSTAYIAYEDKLLITDERNVLMRNQPVNSELSQEQLEKELKRVQKRQSRSGKLKNTVLWLGGMILFASIVSAMWFPVLWITDEAIAGPEHGCVVLTMRMQTYHQDDWVAFYNMDDVIAMQVAAVAGERIGSDEQGYALINGNGHVEGKYLDAVSIVPEDCMLLRNPSEDAVHIVRREAVAGKIILRIWPLPWTIFP